MGRPFFMPFGRSVGVDHGCAVDAHFAHELDIQHRASDAKEGLSLDPPVDAGGGVMVGDLLLSQQSPPSFFLH